MMLLKYENREGGAPANQREAQGLTGLRDGLVPGSLPRPQQADRQEWINLERAIEKIPQWPDRGQYGKNCHERELKTGLEQFLSVVDENKQAGSAKRIDCGHRSFQRNSDRHEYGHHRSPDGGGIESGQSA